MVTSRAIPRDSYQFGKFYAVYQVAISLWSWTQIAQTALRNHQLALLAQPSLWLFSMAGIALGFGLWFKKKWALYLLVVLTLISVWQMYSWLFLVSGAFGGGHRSGSTPLQPWLYWWVFNVGLDFVAIVYFWNRREEFN